MGIGSGYAQVFNSEGAVNLYQNNIRLGIIQAQQERQAVDKMMTTLSADRGKLRSADLKDFDGMYQQLQTLYISNKGLYRNPAKYPEQYRQAQSLISGMRQLTVESQEQGRYFEESMKAYSSDPNKYDQETPTMMEALMAKPTNEVKKISGGSLITPLYFKAIPTPFDMTKEATTFQAYANPLGQEMVQTVKSDTPGYITQQKWTVFPPEAAISYVSSRMLDPKYRRTIRAMYDNDASNGGVRLSEMQTRLDAHLGKDKTFAIKDAESYANAKYMLEFSQTPVESKSIEDKQWKIAQDRKTAAINASRNLSNAKELARYKKSLGPSESKTYDENMAIVDRLRGGNSDADLTVLKSQVSSAYAPSLATDESVSIIGSKTTSAKVSYEQYKNDVIRFNSKAVNKTYQIPTDDRYLRNMYQNGHSIMTIPVMVPGAKKDDPNVKKYILISGNPAEAPNSARKLMGASSILSAPKPTQKRGAFNEPFSPNIDDENGD